MRIGRGKLEDTHLRDTGQPDPARVHAYNVTEAARKALARENPTARRMQFAVSVDTTTVSLELSDDKLTELDIRKLIMNALARRNDLPELNYRLVEIL
jgi:hypothetical protein